MRRRILFTNLLILAGAVLLANHLVSAWRGFEKESNLELVIKKAAGHSSAAAATPVPAVEQTAPFGDFLVVSERNVFSPERRPLADQPAVADVPQPPPLPIKPALNGVSTLGGKRRAFLTVFEGNNTQGQARVVEIGENVQGYVVSEITDSTLTLKWNDHQVLIDIWNSPRPQGAPAKTAAVNVITVGKPGQAMETVKGGTTAPAEDRKVEVGVAKREDVVQTPFGTFVRQPPPDSPPRRPPQ